jgi:uncharacterized protein (TIGR02594 family)
MTLPAQYAWLKKEPGPRILLEALRLHGIKETPGPGNTREIMLWARKVGLTKIYKADSIAWCGLFMAYVALQSGWEPPLNPLWARNWTGFGRLSRTPMLGDVLVFTRGSGGHVGIYVGEDATAFHVLGGNQSDAVTIARIAKGRLITARRCPWRISQPRNVRRVQLASTGAISTNEA